MIRLALAVLLLTAGPAQAGLEAELRAFASSELEAVAAIGARIRFNETGGRDDALITWLEGEDHLSLGIGHFIWYPAGNQGPFLESFILYLEYLQAQGRPPGAWPTPETPCPWPSRAAFLEASGDPRLRDLRRFIETTIRGQTAFLIERLARSLPRLLEAAADRHDPIRMRLERLLKPGGAIDPDGAYALIDYVNFKGEGLDRSERYQSEGWGLLQVLDAMPGDGDPGAAFALAATEVLERRVAHSPPERRESRWLPGWRARVATYATGLGD